MGLFRNAYKNIVDARQSQADRFVNGAYLKMDDESLKAMGKSRAELKRNASSSMLF